MAIQKIRARLTCVVLGTFLWSAIALGSGAILQYTSAVDNQDLATDDIFFAEDGSVISWPLMVRDGRAVQILRPNEPGLLGITVIWNGADISREINWQRTSSTNHWQAQFVGTHEQSGLTIDRTNVVRENSAMLRQLIRIEIPAGEPGRSIQVKLNLPDTLVRHIPGDQFIGDYLYGYGRNYWEDPDVDRYRILTDDVIDTRSIAIAARHIVINVQAIEDSGEIGKWYLTGEGLAQDLIGSAGSGAAEGSRTVTRKHDISARLLVSSADRGGRTNEWMYSENWTPLRFLARGIEILLQYIDSLVGNLAISVVIFALVLRAVFFPLNTWSIRQQRSFSEVQELMRPKIEKVNKTLKGAARSERTLEIYKEHGISPMSGLKGSTALFVQLPFLIALFSVTTESAIFRDVPFLWIMDLSLPDRLWELPLTIPGLGNFINALPILLVAVTLTSSAIQKQSETVSTSKSNRGALLISLLILVLFYSLSAALVLYWIVVNISQIFEGQYVKYTSSGSS